MSGRGWIAGLGVAVAVGAFFLLRTKPDDALPPAAEKHIDPLAVSDAPTPIAEHATANDETNFAAAPQSPAGPPPVTGRVVDLAGAPVAQARVVRPGTTGLDERSMATTDASGEFAFVPETRAIEEYTFRADGCLSLDRVPAMAGDRLDIVLERGTAILRARLLDAVTHAPIAGAIVRTTVDFRNRSSTTTNGEGRFDIVIARSGPLYAQATAEGYTNGSFSFYAAADSDAEEIIFELTPDSALPTAVFRVLDAASGAPLDSAVIGWKPAIPLGNGNFRGAFFFEIENSYAQIESPGHLARRVEFQYSPAATGTTPAIEVKLDPAAEISGRVLLSDGRAAGGARVHAQLSRPAPGDEDMRNERREATADAGGRFTLAGLVRGAAYRLDYAHVEALALEATDDVVAALDSPPLPDVTLDTGIPLAGVVRRAADAAPVAGARVLFLSPGSKDVESTTNETGEFRFAAISGSTAGTIEAAARRLAPKSVEVGLGTATNSPIEIVLDEGLSIDGRVVDAEGRGVAGAWVRARLESGADPLASRFFRDTPPAAVSAADGRFRIEGLLAGGYEVTARLGSRSYQDERGDEREPVDAGTRGLVLRLESPKPATGIAGRVVSARDGRPITRFSVEVPRHEGVGGSKTTGGNGTGQFFQVLEPGVAHEVVVSAPGHANVTLADVVVAEGEVKTATFELPACGTIEGRVATATGEAVAGLQLAFAAKEGERKIVNASSDTNGDFAVGGFDGGDYRITARLEAGEATLPVAITPSEVRIPPGETARLDLTMRPPRGATVSITVDIREDARPRWISVELRSEDGLGRTYTSRRSPDATAFTIPHVAPGDYRATVVVRIIESPDSESTYRATPTPERITVADDSPLTVTLAADYSR